MHATHHSERAKCGTLRVKRIMTKPFVDVQYCWEVTRIEFGHCFRVARGNQRRQTFRKAENQYKAIELAIANAVKKPSRVKPLVYIAKNSLTLPDSLWQGFVRVEMFPVHTMVAALRDLHLRLHPAKSGHFQAQQDELSFLHFGHHSLRAKLKLFTCLDSMCMTSIGTQHTLTQPLSLWLDMNSQISWL